MSQINIPRLLENISEQTTAYMPIVEGIVNSLQSIDESGRTDGQITVRLHREDQSTLALDEESLPAVDGIDIVDNGVGFTKSNRNSFDELYSDRKVAIGGKGFGRLTFLKYFSTVTVESIYRQDDAFRKRTFSFPGKHDLIANEDDESVQDEDAKTIISLKNVRAQYKNRLDKRLETIARRLCEHLLIYFIAKDYACPLIVLEDDEGKITLNNFLNVHDEIQQIHDEEFEITSNKGDQHFNVKVFKIFYTSRASSILLAAHNRVVTDEHLYKYIPEFKDEFYETETNDKGRKVRKNFSVKAYVQGDYLNEHVTLERDDFKFAVENELFHPLSRRQIERRVAEIVKDALGDEITSRQDKKRERVKNYIDTEAPWHKSYADEIDLGSLPYNISDVELEGELQKHKFEKEQSTRAKVNQILREEKQDTVAEDIQKIVDELGTIGKNDLAHYVVLRKVILDLLKKTLQWSADKKYEKEKNVHNLIFPMSADSDGVSYDKHNLWILDERLSFHEYLASDKNVFKTREDGRPDILIFDKPIAVREGEDKSNPITVFEFKRPQREDYGEGEDPILQMLTYIDKIRQGRTKGVKGRTISANEHTPAYAFLVCDIHNDKIVEFARRYSLTPSPDEEGYFGYQSGYGTYVQVICFDKLVKDAELRNKIFFEKLSI